MTRLFISCFFGVFGILIIVSNSPQDFQILFGGCMLIIALFYYNSYRSSVQIQEEKKTEVI